MMNENHTLIENGWVSISEGKIRYRKNQVFYLNRLPLDAKRATKEKMTFETPNKLAKLINYARRIEDNRTQSSLEDALDCFSETFKEFCNIN